MMGDEITDYFDLIEEDNQVQCKFCGAPFEPQNIDGMEDHLELRHADVMV